jgi:CRISPR system Cascade subunit CasE
MIMYLSQILLDLINRNTMSMLSDIYRLHQFVMSGFREYDHSTRVLFRLEPEIRGNISKLLIQSQVKPIWGPIGDKEKGIVMSGMKEFNPQFLRGTSYRFRLRANPIVTRKGKRYGLIRDEALSDWLKKKEQGIGVTFRSISTIDEGYVTGNKKKSESVDRVKIKRARFEGILQVVDPGRFREALNSGIGHAKALGCGLLSLARA